MPTHTVTIVPAAGSSRPAAQGANPAVKGKEKATTMGTETAATGSVPAGAPPRPSSWAVMQARLVTAQVENLLEEACERLARLESAGELPEDVAAAVSETTSLVAAGREAVGAARRHLRGY